MKSMFYDYLNVLAENYLHGMISKDELHKHTLILLENELAHPELFGNWLKAHYASAIEQVFDSEEDKTKEEWIKAIEMSKEESGLFRKYGCNVTADMIDSNICLAEKYVEWMDD